MRAQFNIHEAKTRLSQLIEQVETGGEVVIARAGIPVVRLVRIEEKPPRTLGCLQGRFNLPGRDGPPIPPTPDDFLDAIQGS
ncbi:antitoxin [Lamprobacter modestohalophilus]|uniref:Antitoxin n=1 Tax=Lamprobacter modestohalophilus TaxID=1064514 RepID=A0A9X0WDT3_9GAMM|nr:type II toxin-antitoxin system prevent-host-death family antitoxin [Lamprobacter modestohalophilus]MBK1621715.1 antitoxin [Lamprobacter modestohalophilus]